MYDELGRAHVRGDSPPARSQILAKNNKPYTYQPIILLSRSLSIHSA